MNRRHLLTAGFAAAILAPWADAALADESPVAIVTMLYKVSAGKDGKYSGNSAFFDKRIRAKYFSKRLTGEVAAIDKGSKQADEVGLDFDPITNSQDPSVKTLKIEQDGESDGEAAVKASFSSHDDPGLSVVRYIFVRENKAWKLDTMSGVRTGSPGDSGWELRKLIATLMAGFSK